MRFPIFVLLAACVALAGAPTAGAADYARGMAAGNRGDFQTAMRELRPLAEAGDARAQFAVGQMHHRGYGVASDFAEAARWYRRAADRGHAGAQSNLGYMYANGLGVRRDDRQAEKWFLLAAEQGNTDAQANLGVIYRRRLADPAR